MVYHDFAGHILEWMSFNPTLTTIIFMIGALIAGYEIAILAFNSLVKRHTIGPAMLMCIACVASFIIGHPEEGAAVTFLYYIAEFLEDYAEHRAKRSIKSLVENCGFDNSGTHCGFVRRNFTAPFPKEDTYYFKINSNLKFSKEIERKLVLFLDKKPETDTIMWKFRHYVAKIGLYNVCKKIKHIIIRFF